MIHLLPNNLMSFQTIILFTECFKKNKSTLLLNLTVYLFADIMFFSSVSQSFLVRDTLSWYEIFLVSLHFFRFLYKNMKISNLRQIFLIFFNRNVFQTFTPFVSKKFGVFVIWPGFKRLKIKFFWKLYSDLFRKNGQSTDNILFFVWIWHLDARDESACENK